MKQLQESLVGRLTSCAVVLACLLVAGRASGEILITEYATGAPDFVEIQNLSDSPIVTDGWVVVVNDANDWAGSPDINSFYQTLWQLPPTIAAGDVLYRMDIDDGSGHYWGEDIFWRTSGPGWAMIVDDQGAVADFAVWGYSSGELGYTAEQIASLAINVNGFDITVEDAWTGPAIAPLRNQEDTYQRWRTFDSDDASDWRIEGASMGTCNTSLVPEPSTLTLTAVGMLVAAAFAWRKRQRTA